MGVLIKHTRYCAFCKYWYDPTNSAIRPISPVAWEFDAHVKKKCLKCNSERQGMGTCSYFENKLI